jgi:hypothetical protein
LYKKIFKKNSLLIFLPLLLLIFVPNLVSALEEHQSDPLTKIHNQIFSNQQQGEQYKYYNKIDILPQNKGRVEQEAGDQFTFRLENINRPVLRIFYYGDSLFDPLNIKEPSFELISPSGEKIVNKLSWPEYYFTDLKAGEYKINIKGIDRGYDYKFDIDLVDWKYMGEIIYLSSSNNLSKLNNYIESGDRTVITSNPEIINQLGGSLETASKQESDDVVARTLFETQDKIAVFNNYQSNIYGTDIGSLAVAVENNGDNFIFLSPDLVRLDNSTLNYVESSIHDYFQFQQRLNIFYWLLISLLVLAILSYLILKNRKSLRRNWTNFFKKLNGLRFKNRLAISKAVAFLAIILSVLFIVRSVLNLKIDILTDVVSKINIYLGVKSSEGLVVAIIIFLLIIEISLYYREVGSFLKRLANKHQDKILLIFFIIFVLGIFNLLFGLWPTANVYLVIIDLIILIWLFMATDLKEIDLPIWVKRSFNILMVLTILMLIVKVSAITRPVWDGNWRKSFQLKVEGGQIMADNHFNITSNKKSYNLSNNYLVSRLPTSYSISPDLLFDKPDLVKVGAEIKSTGPVYFRPESDRGLNYLLYYPGLESYYKAKIEDSLAIYLKKGITKKISDSSGIETAINNLPNNLDLELQTETIKKSQDFAHMFGTPISLSKFYKKEIPYNNDLQVVDLGMRINNFQIYSYFEEEIDVTVRKKDLNNDLGTDEAYIAIYGPDNKIFDVIKLRDDNNRLGDPGKSDQVKFNRRIENNGIYNFVFYDLSGQDILIEGINLNSNKLVFSDLSKDEISIYNFYQQNEDSILSSIRKEFFFNPFNRNILHPGSGADILVYPDIEAFDTNNLKLKSSLDFSLTTEDQSYRLKNLQVIYDY